MANNPQVKAAVVWFNSRGAQLKVPLTDDAEEVHAMLRPNLGTALALCYQCLFNTVQTALRDGSDVANRRAVAIYVGPQPAQAQETWHELEDWRRGASRLRGEAALVVTCPAACKVFNDWWRYADIYIDYREGSTGAVRRAAGDLVANTSRQRLLDVDIEEVVPEGLLYLGATSAPSPTLIDKRRLRWHFDGSPSVPISNTITLTYRVTADGIGPRAFANGSVALTDSLGGTRLITAPITSITVTESCELPTATTTPTRAPTATSTATSTPTDTSTVRPSTAYLPSVLAAHCSDVRDIDVALVMDASTSMTEPWSEVESKLEASQSAARVFVDQLAFASADQVSVIAFNQRAHVLVSLTGDRARVLAALDAITTAHQTCLECGVLAARDELLGAQHRRGNTPVMVVLTDGQSNTSSGSEAVARAAEAKAAGIVIFTVGVGDDVDTDTLRAIASKPDYFYASPAGSDLRAIYEALGGAVSCG